VCCWDVCELSCPSKLISRNTQVPACLLTCLLLQIEIHSFQTVKFENLLLEKSRWIPALLPGRGEYSQGSSRERWPTMMSRRSSRPLPPPASPTLGST